MTKFAISLGFPAMNNEAEYEALIAGLEMALTSSCERLDCYCNSEVVVNQAQGHYEARTGMFPQYHSQTMALLPLFKRFSITAIPREENDEAYRLAKFASQSRPKNRLFERNKSKVWVQFREERAIGRELGVMKVDTPPFPADNWRSPIIVFFLGENVPADRKERRQLQARAARFYLHKGLLYKRGYIN